MAICPIRAKVVTGDLIAWDQPMDNTGGFWLKVVRFFTMSEYGHVSVAVREGDTLYHIEAVIPRIRKIQIPNSVRFYTIPLSKVIDGPIDLTFIQSKIGHRYSLLDALRGYLGRVTKNNDRWQCAELTNEFYKGNGLDIFPKKMTPSDLVAAAMQIEDLHLSKSCSELKPS